MCDYQGYEFGAGRYPDSLCIDGRLFDADNCDDGGSLYEPMEYIPCPICHRGDAIEYWTERNSFFADEEMSDDEVDKLARENAISLVDDIRKNRGIEPPTERRTREKAE